VGERRENELVWNGQLKRCNYSRCCTFIMFPNLRLPANIRLETIINLIFWKKQKIIYPVKISGFGGDCKKYSRTDTKWRKRRWYRLHNHTIWTGRNLNQSNNLMNHLCQNSSYPIIIRACTVSLVEIWFGCGEAVRNSLTCFVSAWKSIHYGKAIVIHLRLNVKTLHFTCICIVIKFTAIPLTWYCY